MYWIYRTYRNEFLSWTAKHFSQADRELRKDVFQESVIELHTNAVSGRLTEFTSSIKTYLFQIGKFKIINELKKRDRITYQDQSELIKDHNSAAMDDDQESEENQEKLKTAIKVLSPDCKKILELFYFKEYDMESIARDMYYKNADTAKSKKSLCMKCLIKEMNKLSKLMVF